jgi:hypothetical protein
MKSLASRRKFLKQTLTGTAVLSAAKFIPMTALAAELTQNDVPAPLVFFSRHEFRIIRAVAESIVGLHETSAEPVHADDVALRADQFLAVAEPEIQEQFHLLLVLFNSPIFTFVFDFQLKSFLDMSKPERDAYLNGWMTSIFAFRRTAFQGLKRLCMSMYYTDSKSWNEIHYSGMFLPENRQ